MVVLFLLQLHLL
jgi:hypothetical protein